MKFLTHLMVIFALLSSGVSPACAFVSSQSDAPVIIDGVTYIEICSGLDVIRIAIDAEGNRTSTRIAGGNSSSDDGTHANAFDDCSFCFAQAHVKQISDRSFDFSSYVLRVRGGVVYNGAGQIVSAPVSLAHGVRAPPVFS